MLRLGSGGELVVAEVECLLHLTDLHPGDVPDNRVIRTATSGLQHSEAMLDCGNGALAGRQSTSHDVGVRASRNLDCKLNRSPTSELAARRKRRLRQAVGESRVVADSGRTAARHRLGGRRLRLGHFEAGVGVSSLAESYRLNTRPQVSTARAPPARLWDADFLARLHASLSPSMSHRYSARQTNRAPKSLRAKTPHTPPVGQTTKTWAICGTQKILVAATPSLWLPYFHNSHRCLQLLQQTGCH